MEHASIQALSAPVDFSGYGSWPDLLPPSRGEHTHARPAACRADGLTPEDARRLDGMLFARRRIREGQDLYCQGDRFRFVYAVRSGTFKNVVAWRDGRERVTAFRMAGDVLGIDGMAEDAYPSTATALEDAEICAIPHTQLRRLAPDGGDAHDLVAQLLGREIMRDQALLRLLGSMTADERVAAFLLEMSQRMRLRGYSPLEFHLRMSRAEIGSYLGVTLETVSRTFSTFQQRGWLRVAKKHVRILDLAALARAVEGEPA